MRLVNRSAPDLIDEIDRTRWLVGAIAQELWRLYGRSGALMWADVERHLSRITEQARSDLRDTGRSRVRRPPLGIPRRARWSVGRAPRD